MAVLIEELVFKAVADMKDFDREVDLSVKRATEKVKNIPNPFEQASQRFNQMGDSLNTISPEFDFSNIHEFNTLIDVKIAHWNVLRREVEENPIIPRISYYVERGSLEEQLLLVRTLKEEAKGLNMPARVQLQSPRGAEASSVRQIDLGDNNEGETIRKGRDTYYSTSAQPEKKIIKQIGTELSSVLKEGTQNGIEAGMDKFLGKLEQTIPSIGDTIVMSIASTAAGQLTNSFLEYSGVNETVKERVLQARAVADRVAPQILEPIKEKSTIVREGIRRFAGKVGIDSIETFENSKSTPEEKRSKIFESLTNAFQKEMTQIGKELDDRNKPFDGKIIVKEMFAPLLANLDVSIRKNRIESIQTQAAPLALERAVAIMAKQEAAESAAAQEAEAEGGDVREAVANAGKKKNTGLVVDDTTEKLVIVSGGYAGKKGLSGLRLPSQMAPDLDEKTKAIGIVNKDNDANDNFLRVDSEIYKNLQLAILGLEESSIFFTDEIADLLKTAIPIIEMNPSSKLASLAKPNLRGYSNDAIEMSAQALVALQKNPNLKIELVGESGGGFVAEEAAEILNALGHKDKVTYLGAGTPNLIGGLNPENGSKVLSPSEPLGYLNTSALLPLGLSKMTESQQVAGFYSHAFDQDLGYQENQLAEYQNATKGAPGRMPEDEILQLREGLQVVSKIEAATASSVTKSNLQQKLMKALQRVRRHAVTASPDQSIELDLLVKQVEDQFIRFSPESDDLSSIRYGLETASKSLDKHKENPGIASALDLKEQLAGLREARPIFNKMANNDPKNGFGTEEAKKYSQLKKEFERLEQELQSISTLTAKTIDPSPTPIKDPLIENRRSGRIKSVVRNAAPPPINPANFFEDSERIVTGEQTLRSYQIQYLQELASRATNLSADIQRLTNTEFPVGQLAQTSQQNSLDVVQKPTIDPLNIPSAISQVAPVVKPIKGTIGEVADIKNLTGQYRKSVSLSHADLQAATKPLKTQRDSKTISNESIDRIAELYVKVKEASIRAVAALSAQAERLKEIIENSDDDIVSAEAKAALYDVQSAKGSISAHVTSQVKSGIEGDAALKASEDGSWIGKMINQNSKLPEFNPAMNARLREKISFYENRTSRVAAVDPQTVEVANKIDKPILSATAQRMKNRRLGRQDADLEGGFFRVGGSSPDEDPEWLKSTIVKIEKIQLATQQLGRDAVSFIFKRSEKLKQLQIRLVKARDEKRNAKKFDSPMYLYAPAQQLPRQAELPEGQDPLYNEAWGKYYDDQIAGRQAIQPRKVGDVRMDFVAAGLSPEERKKEMVANYQDDFLDRLNAEAVGEKDQSSSFFGYFKVPRSKLSKPTETKSPQAPRPKVESLISDFPEELQEQQLEAFDAAMKSKIRKSNENDAGFGLPIQEYVKAINNKVGDLMDSIELGVKGGASKAFQLVQKTKTFEPTPESEKRKDKGLLEQAFFSSGDIYNKGLKSLGDISDYAEEHLHGLYSTLKLVALGIGGLIASGGIAGAVSAFIKFSDAGTAAARSYELLQFQATNATGSIASANRILSDTDKKASERGLSINSARATKIQFQGATKDTALEGEVAEFIADSISKGAVAKGLTDDQAQRASVGFVQAIAKEKLGPEELSGQIAEAGFYDVKPTLARSLGVPTSGIEKLSKTNQLGTSEILKLVSTIGADADSSPLESGKTINASFTRLDNSKQKFFESYGEGAKAILPIIEVMSKSIDLLSQGVTVFGAVLNGAVVYGLLKVGSLLLSTSAHAAFTRSVFGMLGNTLKALTVQIGSTLWPIALVTAGMESLFSIIRNMRGETIFDQVGNNIAKNAAKIKEAADTVKGIKPIEGKTDQDKKDADNELSGNWFDQGLDYARKGINAGLGLKGGNESAAAIGAAAVPGGNILLNGANALSGLGISKLTTQRELNETLGREKLTGQIIPSIQPSIDSANSILSDEPRLRKLAGLRESIAQNKIAQEKTDETESGKAQYEKLRKAQNVLEIDKIKTEAPLIKAESALSAQKAELQGIVDKNAFPEQKKELMDLIDAITVTQQGFKRISAAVSETTRTFARNTETLARYDQALEQSKARIAMKGSQETAQSYIRRSSEDSDSNLSIRSADQSIATDQRELAAIEDDLTLRKKKVSEMRELVGSDTLKLDPVKDKKEYDQVEALTTKASKLKSDSAKLFDKGGEENVNQSYQKESEALRLEQKIIEISQSKSNLVYDAEKLNAVKAAEDKVLSLMQEAAGKSSAITKAKVERNIQIEKNAMERIEFFYQQDLTRNRIVSTNNQASLIPVVSGQTAIEYGQREAAVNLTNADNSFRLESKNQEVLKEAISSKTLKLTGKEAQGKLLEADARVAEARKTLLEAEKGVIVANSAATVRQVEVAQMKIEAITAKIERDAAIAASKASRAALTPVNLKQSFLAIDISETVQKLQGIKNEAAGLEASKSSLAQRKDNLARTITPDDYQELQGAFATKPELADSDQLATARGILEGQKDRTPAAERQLAYIKQREEIQKLDVDLEAKKTSLATSMNQAQKDVQSKMKQIYESQAQLAGSIIADTAALEDELRKATEEVKQGSMANKIRESLLGVTGFMGEFAEAMLTLMESAASIGAEASERVITDLRAKGKYNSQLDQNKQSAASVVAEAAVTFGTTSDIPKVEGVGGGGVPTLINRFTGSGRAELEGPTTEFTGSNTGGRALAKRVENLAIVQKTSTGYQVDPSGSDAEKTVARRTSTSEPVRTFDEKGQAVITTVNKSFADYLRLSDKVSATKLELDVVKFNAALNTFDGIALKITKDLNETVRGAQQTSIANSFGDRELRRSSRRTNYIDQSEGIKDETIKSFLADQKAVDDDIRSLEAMLTHASSAPEKLLDAINADTRTSESQKVALRQKIESFGGDTAAGQRAIGDELASRKARKATLPELYEGVGSFKQNELRDTQAEKVDSLQSNAQTSFLREKAGVEGTDKYEVARLTGQAALIENEATFKKGLRDLRKELVETNLAGTEAGNAIEANFKKINEMKLDKIRAEVNLMTGQISSALTGEFTSAILSVGDVFSKAFERLTNPERFKNAKGGIRELGDSLVDTLKALGSGVLSTLAKISAEAAAASISKWATGGITNFMNGVLGISTTPAAKDAPTMPEVQVAAANAEIPTVLRQQPAAIVQIHKAEAAVEVAKQEVISSVRPADSSVGTNSAKSTPPLPLTLTKPREKTPLNFAEQIARQQEEGLPAFRPVEPVRSVYTPPIVLPVQEVTPVLQPIPAKKNELGPLIEMDFSGQIEPVNATATKRIKASPASSITADPNSDVKNWLIPPPEKLTEAGNAIGEAIIQKLKTSELPTSEILSPLPTGEDIGSRIGSGQSFTIEAPSTPKLDDDGNPIKVDISTGGEAFGREMAKTFSSAVQGAAGTAVSGGNVGQSLIDQGVSAAGNFAIKGAASLVGDLVKSVFGFADGGVATDNAPLQIFAEGGVAGYSKSQIEQAMREEGKDAMLGVIHKGEIMVSKKTGDADILNSLIADGTWADRKHNRAAVYAAGGVGGGATGMPAGSRSTQKSGPTYNDNSTTINVQGASNEGRDRIGYDRDQLELRQQRAAARNQYRSR